MSSTRRRPPETLAQAQQATARCERLRALGIGPACAGRLAFAGQKDAAPVDRPCPACLPVVLELGGCGDNGWKVTRAALANAALPPQDMPGVVVCLAAVVATDRRVEVAA